MNYLKAPSSMTSLLCCCIFLLSSRQSFAFLSQADHGIGKLTRGVSFTSPPMITPSSTPSFTSSFPVVISDVRPRTSSVSSPTQLKGTVTDFISFLQNIPDGTDLTLGALIVFMAAAPYFLGLFFPDFFDSILFLPVYGDNAEEGRIAENNWKKMYATEGLVLTTLLFWSALDETKTTIDVLRSGYVSWALFYIAATIKLARENQMGIVEFNRIPSQIWHLAVAAGLIFDVSIQPTSLEVLSNFA